MLVARFARSAPSASYELASFDEREDGGCAYLFVLFHVTEAATELPVRSRGAPNDALQLRLRRAVLARSATSATCRSAGAEWLRGRYVRHPTTHAATRAVARGERNGAH
jgi:hypothetical protein